MMQKIKIDVRTALEIVGHEAVIRQTYRDSVGVLTWSVGLTKAAGVNVEAYIGKPQPMSDCLKAYLNRLGVYAAQVLEAFDGYTLSQNEFAAALSFHYNTGGIKRASWVTLVKQGKKAEAKIAFMKWNKPKEIVGRRRKERDLFFDSKWSQTGKVLEYTQVNPKTLSPVWSSGKLIDITADVRAILGVQEPRVVTLDTVIPAPMAVATGVAGSTPKAYTPSSWEALKGWLSRLFS